MATISKANRPRKAPGMTRNGKISIRSLSVERLELLLEKTSRPRDQHKIRNLITKKKARKK